MIAARCYGCYLDDFAWLDADLCSGLNGSWPCFKCSADAAINWLALLWMCCLSGLMQPGPSWTVLGEFMVAAKIATNAG